MTEFLTGYDGQGGENRIKPDITHDDVRPDDLEIILYTNHRSVIIISFLANLSAYIAPQIDAGIDFPFDAKFNLSNIFGTFLTTVDTIHDCTKLMRVMDPVSFNKGFKFPAVVLIQSTVSLQISPESQAGLYIAIPWLFTSVPPDSR